MHHSREPILPLQGPEGPHLLNPPSEMPSRLHPYPPHSRSSALTPSLTTSFKVVTVFQSDPLQPLGMPQNSL